MLVKAAQFEAERVFWNHRYLCGGNSGGGSYGAPMLRKVHVLAALPAVASIVEVGCGDFTFGRHLLDRCPAAHYIGFDVSDEIVARNRKLYGLPRVHFYEMAGSIVPSADLLLCVDVLFHVIEDWEYEALLLTLRQRWTKYLAVTAYEYDGLREDHVRIRKFDPAVFGVPVHQETIEDDGKMQFYIFRRVNEMRCDECGASFSLPDALWSHTCQ